MPRRGQTKEVLKPFKKGDDPRRNLKGAPHKLPELDVLMAEILGEEKDGISAAQQILRALRARAAKGDIRAAEVLLDRGYGKPKQSTDITTNGKDLTPVQIVFRDFQNE